MNPKDILLKAIENSRGDLIYDNFMYQSLDVKLKGLVYLIENIAENEQGYHFITIMIQLIHNPENLNVVVVDMTPLQEAIHNNKIEFFNLLLLNGASLEKRNKSGLSSYDMILNSNNDVFLDFIINYENVITDVYNSIKYK